MGEGGVLPHRHPFPGGRPGRAARPVPASSSVMMAGPGRRGVCPGPWTTRWPGALDTSSGAADGGRDPEYARDDP